MSQSPLAAGQPILASVVVAPPKTKSPAKEKKSRVRKNRESKQQRSTPTEGKVFNTSVFLWLVLLHVGSLFAPWTFTWVGLATMVFLHWLNSSIGICLGYHRLLTHGSFQTYRPVRWMLAFLGGLAGEGTAVDWVANHRKHHALSDQDGDPHSPHDGAWWSHMTWLFYRLPHAEYVAHTDKWAKDLKKDTVLVWIGNLFLASHFVLGFIVLGIGYAIGGWSTGISMVVWGMFLRLTLVLHTTWFVNSASHMFGYRNYETTDDSRNNWWVAIIAYGEGWHNNHHAYPRMAQHGHRWWEYDATYLAIRVMKLCGLVWDVVDYKRKSEALDG